CKEEEKVSSTSAPLPCAPRSEKPEVITGGNGERLKRKSNVVFDPINCERTIYFDKNKPSTSIFKTNSEVRHGLSQQAEPKNQVLIDNDAKIYRKEEKESKNENFGSEDGAHDRIYVLSESEEPLSNVIHADSPPLEIFPGEEAEYLSEFTRVVGGDVTLDRRRHTAKVQVFAGAR
ncbi:unnamed protein product, partial [Scytosiphon promiscuus]